MATPASTNETWRFGVFEVDTRRVELRRAGIPIKLREQSFLILAYLVEHAGEIVTREELRSVLWPSDTYVDFDHSLNTAMMKLREALGDSTGTPLYIETIPKRGYRFIAPVSSVTDARNGQPKTNGDPVSPPIKEVAGPRQAIACRLCIRFGFSGTPRFRIACHRQPGFLNPPSHPRHNRAGPGAFPRLLSG